MSWQNTKKYKCPSCKSVRLSKDGTVKGKQRYLCMKCRRRTIVPKIKKSESGGE